MSRGEGVWTINKDNHRRGHHNQDSRQTKGGDRLNMLHVGNNHHKGNVLSRTPNTHRSGNLGRHIRSNQGDHLVASISQLHSLA